MRKRDNTLLICTAILLFFCAALYITFDALRQL